MKTELAYNKPDINPEVAAKAAKQKLPLSSLLALTMASFIVLLTEVLPAGLLPQIATSLNSSEALMGQLITVYALGSLLSAIPLAAATQRIDRRTLLLIAIAGFGVVNTITAVSDNLTVIFVARFLGGVAAGLVWSMIAGYAARMVHESQKGRAIAIAMAGPPLALTMGIPIGAFLGSVVGWRTAFGLISALALLLIFWVMTKLPAFPTSREEKRRNVVDVFVLPGMRPIMAAMLLYVLAHSILYTYISPLLALAELVRRTDFVLLVFGGTSLVGLFLVGILVDRWLRQLALASTALFLFASIVFALFPASPSVIYISVGLWGLAFGGVATLFVTAIANAAGPAQDVAQSITTTVWNTAIGAGSLAGGMLLDRFGAHSFSYTATAILLAALLITWLTRNKFYWRGAMALA